jgi:hypothetical protein
VFSQRGQQRRFDRMVNDINLISGGLASDCGERFGGLPPQLLQDVIAYNFADGR